MAQGGMGRVPALLARCASQTSRISRSNRYFSSTSPYSKEFLAAFKPSSSPELDALLTNFRQNLLIPLSLSSRHRRLIYRDRFAEQIKDNPISVNVGGEEEESYRLRHMTLTDHPGDKELRQMVSLMKTHNDWLNMIPFLIGLQNANRPLSTKRLAWVVRKAGLAGQAGVMLEAAKQWRRTGVTLNDPAIATALFLAIRYNAQQVDFKGEEAQKALRQARTAAELLDAPEHTATDPKRDAKRLPGIIAILLELSAAEALNSGEGKDVRGEVRAYAQRVISTWPLGDFDIPAERHAAQFKLFELVPIWHGMSLALQVEEVKTNAELSEGLKSCMSELGKTIDTIVENVTKESGDAKREGVELAKRLCHR
ncbi:predicted protein [Uncinocarpus reesii 1704]|uniref:Uncharacterized protein n=1 Tax=Uncinocarpus reesii (strain UAMH 1704) TaxID=336963 RepID=C4JLY3_UNCRE|nr:uncharacterized protein UREG_03841 [Uncinocarpus reesii 1704]EEP78995.1 predicted protein [Uncinocarpus reesii 1704]